jgi:DNA polymerase elongation subunit (family B)
MLFYDFECFRHDWLVVIMDTDTKSTHVIVNDRDKLITFYNDHKDDIWCGYNSRGYDQYIMKGILLGMDPYDISKHIIQDHKPGWQYSNDFRKIQLYNYDVMTTFHGLKQLEGFMGNDIRETTVPFNINRKLTNDEIQEVIKYCKHDVSQTIEVFINRIEEFESHLSLLKTFQLPLSYISKTKAQLSAIILGAWKQERNDEFNITIPDTLRIRKYKHIVDWYLDPSNRNYSKSLKTDVAGIPHTFAWGGLHGAIDKYQGEGIFVNVDVSSFYPAIMIEYGFLSRNVVEPEKYKEIRDTRLKLKAEGNPMQQPYKIVLNSTYGAMKDKYNALYDPRQANNVCVAGQLLLLDLIEHLEPHCKLIQSNTDGLFVKLYHENDLDIIKEVCKEWENRTRMSLDYEIFTKIYQKDVNNYIVIHEDGSYESKGAYVKKLNNLDYDLPIVNKALVEYFINGAPVEETINNCNDLKEFQMIVKVSNKFQYAQHGNKKLNERVLRVFASKEPWDGKVYRMNSRNRLEKIPYTPDSCFIRNNDVNGKRIPRRLDKQWYIDVAKKRLKDFIGIEDQMNIWEMMR